MAAQQVDKIVFGSGRLFVNTPGGPRLAIADLNDVSVDIKIDLKEIYGENAYALAVADGHRTIDIQAKHYTLNLGQLTTDLNGSAVGANSNAFVVDEAGIVGATTYSLAATSTYVANSLSLVVYTTPGGAGQPVLPVTYSIVAAGSEVAGKAASVNNATGVVTFAAGDTGLALRATYQKTNALGSAISIANPSQNSTTPYSMTLVKRDRSQVDGSSGQLIMTFNAVRPGGAKFDFKEGEFTNIDRMYKAFADPSGNVATIQFVNI